MRTRILAASRRLLARGGLDSLTISAIAAEAGVYSSAIFYHFGGKEGLWAALVTGLLREAESLAETDLHAMPVGRGRVDRVVELYDLIGGSELQSAFFETLIPALRHAELRLSWVSLYEDGKDRIAIDLGAAEHPEQTEALRRIGQIVLAFTDGMNVQRLVNPDADHEPTIALFEDMVARTLLPLLGIAEDGQPGDAGSSASS